MKEESPRNSTQHSVQESENPEHQKRRKHLTRFSSRAAFVIAAAASAIGLGNLWRFPSLAAKYGGGAFLVTYIILVVTIGFTLMITEVALGRKTGKSVLGAFSSFGRKYTIIGILSALVPAIITPYYCVIGGWISKYLAIYISGNGSASADGGVFFLDYISSSGEPVFWTVLFVAAVMIVVFMGLNKGIEKLNLVAMPALLLVIIGITLYVLTIPGSMEGVAYYLTPRFEDFGINTVIAAMGQVFFSLSLAMGIMVTYGSYMSKETNIEKSVRQIEVADTSLAFLCGLMIIPAVFAFSGAEGAKEAGPGLLFITMPRIFDMMAFPEILGSVFFLAIFFAAHTSAVSLSETLVSLVMDTLGWGRKPAAVLVTFGVLLLAIPPTLGFSDWGFATLTIGSVSMTILDIMDFLSNSVMMPLVALLLCLFVGYWAYPPVAVITEEIEQTKGVRFRMKRSYRIMIRYVTPIVLVIILVSSVLNGLGIIVI